MVCEGKPHAFSLMHVHRLGEQYGMCRFSDPDSKLWNQQTPLWDPMIVSTAMVRALVLRSRMRAVLLQVTDFDVLNELQFRWLGKMLKSIGVCVALRACIDTRALRAVVPVIQLLRKHSYALKLSFLPADEADVSADDRRRYCYRDARLLPESDSKLARDTGNKGWVCIEDYIVSVTASLVTHAADDLSMTPGATDPSRGLLGARARCCIIPAAVLHSRCCLQDLIVIRAKTSVPRLAQIFLACAHFALASAAHFLSARMHNARAACRAGRTRRSRAARCTRCAS